MLHNKIQQIHDELKPLKIQIFCLLGQRTFSLNFTFLPVGMTIRSLTVSYGIEFEGTKECNTKVNQVLVCCNCLLPECNIELPLSDKTDLR